MVKNVELGEKQALQDSVNENISGACDFDVELEILDTLAAGMAHLIVEKMHCNETWATMAEYCNFAAEKTIPAVRLNRD